MGIKKTFLLLSAACFLAGCNSNSNSDNNPTKTITSGEVEEEQREMHNYSIYDEGVDFDNKYWQKPDYFYDEELDNEGCKAVFIRNDYNGLESYLFAYLGLPAGELHNAKAVVLVHGGGGTAYHEWVNAWVNKGYVALAIDTEGHIPNKNGKITDYPKDLYHASTYVAPHNQNLADENEDLTKTWLHYACRSAIIANSFLHNLEGVDPYKIGICGISWGGYITSIVSSYDDRFAFSIPIYCCAPLMEAGTPIGGYQKAHPTFNVFDKIDGLIRIETPFLYVVSDSDVHGNVIVASNTISSLKNGYLVVSEGLLHSHMHALNISEPYTFAEDVLNNRYKFKMSFVSPTRLKVEVPEGKELRMAILHTTNEELIEGSFRTNSRELDLNDLEDGCLKLKIKEDVTYYFVSCIDEGGNTHTSLIQKNN